MSELTVPQIDFSSLGQLPQIYKQGQQNALRQQTLANLGQGTATPDDLIRAGIQIGDLQLANLGTNQKNTEYQHGRDTVSDQHWAITDKRAANADARAGAAESRNARDWENTPDQYVPNPSAGQPGQPQYIDQYADATAAARARAANFVPPDGFIRQQDGSLKPIPGGPQDPKYIGESESAKAKAKAAAGGDSPEYGLNPVWGVGSDGKPALVQLSKNGKTYQPQLPDGFQISRDPIRVDAGTHINLLDPQTRQIVGTLPKDIAGAERAKEEGSAAGLAAVNLPQTLAVSDQILKTIDQVKNHPGKQYALGLYSKLPTVPGTSQADFRAAAGQLNGQTFLQAYQTLRGGGAITDIEGAKGTAALARLDQAQTTQEYDKALDEFRGVVQKGMDRAKAKAAGTNAAPAAVPAVVDYKTYFGN